MREFEKKFHELADKWAEETAVLSSPPQMRENPNYKAIMEMVLDPKNELKSYDVTQKMIQLILIDLIEHRRHWFWALSELTGENPIPSEDAGRIMKMIEAWKNWGIKKGYINV
jgi:hypothetical protein